MFQQVKTMKIKNISILFIAACFLANTAFSKNDKNIDKHESLPPGLEKKQSQGKPLPPSWQMKLSRGDILANDIYVRGKVVVPLGKNGTISISVDGTIVKLMC